MAKQRTESDPFISLNLRAWVESKDPYEQAAVTALVFWHWWKGNNEGLGVEGLAALGKMSPAKAKAVAATLRSRGWIETSRKFGGKTEYRLTVEKMTFKDAYIEVIKWLPHSQLDSDQLSLWKPSISYSVANNELPHSRPNIKRSDLSKTKPPDKAGDGMKAYTDYFYRSYSDKYGAEPIPPKFAFVNLAALIKHGVSLEAWETRVDNYFADAYITAHALQDLIRDWDKFAKRRMTREDAAAAAKKAREREQFRKDLSKGAV